MGRGNDEQELDPPRAGHSDDEPRFPHADDITIPEGVTLEEPEPARTREEQRPRRARVFGAWIGRRFRRAGSRVRMAFDWLLLAITFPAPALVLAWQSFEWLRTSAWPPVPVERLVLLVGLDPSTLAHTPWPGLSRVADWVLAAPLTAVLFCTGLGLHLLSGLLFPRISVD